MIRASGFLIPRAIPYYIIKLYHKVLGATNPGINSYMSIDNGGKSQYVIYVSFLPRYCCEYFVKVEVLARSVLAYILVYAT